MKRLWMCLLFVALFAPIARPQFQRIDISIFGMD
jgi:hypothetical protein